MLWSRVPSPAHFRARQGVEHHEKISLWRDRLPCRLPSVVDIKGNFRIDAQKRIRITRNICARSLDFPFQSCEQSLSSLWISSWVIIKGLFNTNFAYFNLRLLSCYLCVITSRMKAGCTEKNPATVKAGAEWVSWDEKNTSCWRRRRGRWLKGKPGSLSMSSPSAREGTWYGYEYMHFLYVCE